MHNILFRKSHNARLTQLCAQHTTEYKRERGVEGGRERDCALEYAGGTQDVHTHAHRIYAHTHKVTHKYENTYTKSHTNMYITTYKRTHTHTHIHTQT